MENLISQRRSRIVESRNGPRVYLRLLLLIWVRWRSRGGELADHSSIWEHIEIVEEEVAIRSNSLEIGSE